MIVIPFIHRTPRKGQRGKPGMNKPCGRFLQSRYPPDRDWPVCSHNIPEGNFAALKHDPTKALPAIRRAMPSRGKKPAEHILSQTFQSLKPLKSFVEGSDSVFEHPSHVSLFFH